MTPGPYLVALLPVRNGERWLSHWLEAASQWADAVIALDDGSTDATASILQSHALVDHIISNPARATYEGWDDGANRQRLLDAVDGLEPRWVMYLDADERIAPSDNRRLRHIAEEGTSGFAYGFRVHSASDDLASVDPAGKWVFRMFAWEPGLQLPEKRLHLVPIPDSIPRPRWLRTAVRILHLGIETDSDRTARFNKYLEADPHRQWQDSYDHVLERPGAMVPLEQLGTSTTPVLSPKDRVEHGRPIMSAIVISHDDEATLDEAVTSVVEQALPGEHEVIVVNSGSRAAAARIRRRFPSVEVVELPDPVLPGAARNEGLAIARGDFVAFPSSHIVLPPGSLAARVRAHTNGWAMVTGPVLNGNSTRSGWASYFLDHSALLPGRTSGELPHPPTRCSYVRGLLNEAGGFPEDRRAGEDTVVNLALWRLGYSAFRVHDATAIHISPCSTVGALASHHYQRGSAWGQILLERYGSRRQLLLRRGLPLSIYVLRRLARIGRNIRNYGRELQREYRRSFHLVVLGTMAAFLGIVVRIAAGPAKALTRTGADLE